MHDVSHRIAVQWFHGDHNVTWMDGKPRCARHRTCLIGAQTVGLYGPGYICATCARREQEETP